MPFLIAEPYRETRPEFAMFETLIHPIFPEAKVVNVQSLEGHLHLFYRITLSNDLNLILKTARKEFTSLLRQERFSLQAEAEVLSLLENVQHPYIPQLLRYDTLKFPPRTPYLVRPCIPGVPLSDIESSLTINERNGVDRQIGRMVNFLGQHTSTRFGYVHDVAQGGGKRGWKSAFLSFIESLLCDAEDMFISLPFHEIREQVARLAPVLRDVAEPQLVVVDLGRPCHVLVDADSKEVTGFTDFSSAVWGDPFLVDVFTNPSTAFLDGYGHDVMDEGSYQIRILLYSCYHHLKNLVRQYYRNRNDDEEMRARRVLTANLAEMSEL
ncbi:hypothetical protein AJ80_04305 [Polytolypa hystricis UAMH7299]|uniref:Aminoglycoside phosphotransferase domain-containing protein n=1 Tax=Polytolypa hystricis (strain UAMH7299) TaxID=1447883 RepID=A0A2B7YE52_POLH7|nr:hypothetical protein AJ80_04305 [Polytolypa hystricis UAMH7299]